MTAPVPFPPVLVSWVKSRVLVKGLKVDPSIALNPVRLVAGLTGVSRVKRCARSDTSRLMREVAGVLVALIQEMTAIIEARGGTARIVIESQIEVLIGFGAHAGAQLAEHGDEAARVLQRIGGGGQQPGRKVGINQRRLSGVGYRRHGVGDADLDLADAVASFIGTRRRRG